MTTQNLVATIAGLLFGLGLSISQMTDPLRVLSFLDVTGAWDPTLLFVMGGAVSVTAIAFRLVLSLPRPIAAEKFYLPTQSQIDVSLLLGAAIFGVGWGIAGYCPGPALTGLVSGSINAAIFVSAMTIGSLAVGLLLGERRQ